MPSPTALSRTPNVADWRTYASLQSVKLVNASSLPLPDYQLTTHHELGLAERPSNDLVAHSKSCKDQKLNDDPG